MKDVQILYTAKKYSANVELNDKFLGIEMLKDAKFSATSIFKEKCFRYRLMETVSN